MCYCDTACFEIFKDCCSDYIKHCGIQKPSDIWIKKFKWNCELFGRFGANQNCSFSNGLWMVSRCPDDYSDDEIRSACENPSNDLREANQFFPLVSRNLTFRNYYCAVCNNISEDFDYFLAEFKTNVIPPVHYSFVQTVDFLLSNLASLNRPPRPKSSQSRRYCFKDMIDTCPNGSIVDTCRNGPVAVVSSLIPAPALLKNYNCSLCYSSTPVCFPVRYPVVCRNTSQWEKFLLRLNYYGWTLGEKRYELNLLNTVCQNNGLIFDDELQECVDSIPVRGGMEDKFRILVWFASSDNSNFTKKDFETFMKQYMHVEYSQMNDVDIETVPLATNRDHVTTNFTSFYHLVRLTLLLTPEQSFEILYKIDSNNFTLNLQSFIHFKTPLTVIKKNKTYFLIKTTSRSLSCIRRTIESQENHLKDRMNFSMKVEYYGKRQGRFATDEVHLTSFCETNRTGLTKNHFIIYRNLSLYEKSTGNVYKLGQYAVFNNLITLCGSEQSSTAPCPLENTCKGRCTNVTEWRTEEKIICSCDPDCYEAFNDCCPDYTKYCGAQRPRKTKAVKYTYTCERMGNIDESHCLVADGVWMVTRCRTDWPYDSFRRKCEKPVNELILPCPDLSSYLPVVSDHNITFRNMFCAICNDIKNYDPWALEVETAIIPPENYNLTEKISFLLSHNIYVGVKRPEKNQVSRYCTSKDDFEPCVNDDEIYISAREKSCMSCPSKLPPVPFTLIFHSDRATSQIKSRVSTRSKCGSKIFDESLQVCRVDWLRPPEQSREESFFVYVWIKTQQEVMNNSFSSIDFKESLSKYLNLSELQLYDVNIATLSVRGTKYQDLLYLVSSTIRLTPEQSFELLSANGNANTTTPATRLRNYIYFSQAFTLLINGIPYTIVKTTSRPLACVGKTTYIPVEYTLNNDEQMFIPSTNKTYNRFEYFWENEMKQGNITVCAKHMSIRCKGTIVSYTIDEYAILDRMNIYVKKTSSSYNYGEYKIFSNKSVEICMRKYMRGDIITESRKTIRGNEVLGYLTLIFFLLSILSLVFLLVTYIIFPNLRTLPGKNLMNFAASLLLFMIFWLPSDYIEVRLNKKTCMAVAIIEHYSLIALFVSKSVIAFHTFKVFARNLPAPKMSEGQEKKFFCGYMTLVWLFPAVFVGICLELDRQGLIGYGKSDICWLTEENAYIYLVTIPIAVLLSFNVIAFSTTAVYLRRHGENIAARQASGNRRSNLSIYVKLSTLMGFSWLFGVLGLVVTSTTVFWYFFVILTSLQGLFVTIAFVINSKTISLYKGRFSSSVSKTKASGKNNPVNRHVETRL